MLAFVIGGGTTKSGPLRLFKYAESALLAKCDEHAINHKDNTPTKTAFTTFTTTPTFKLILMRLMPVLTLDDAVKPNASLANEFHHLSTPFYMQPILQE